MSDIVFNVAKGRAVELANRVKSGDPAAARLYAIPVDRAAVTDATLKDCADLAAVISAGVTERRWWHRKRDRQERVLREVVSSVEERLDALHADVTAIREAQVRHLEAHAEGRTS